MMCSFYKSREMKTERMSWGENVREQIKAVWGRRERRRRRKRAILFGVCTRGWLFCLIKSVEKDAFPRVPGLN